MSRVDIYGVVGAEGQLLGSFKHIEFNRETVLGLRDDDNGVPVARLFKTKNAGEWKWGTPDNKAYRSLLILGFNGEWQVNTRLWAQTKPKEWVSISPEGRCDFWTVELKPGTVAVLTSEHPPKHYEVATRNPDENLLWTLYDGLVVPVIKTSWL